MNNFKPYPLFDVFRENGLAERGEKECPNNFLLQFTETYKMIELNKDFYLKGIDALEKKAMLVDINIDTFTDAELLLIVLLGSFNDYRANIKHITESNKYIAKLNTLPEVELLVPDADELIKNPDVTEEKYDEFCKTHEKLLKKCSSPNGDESFWCYNIKREGDIMWCICANNTLCGLPCGRIFKAKMIVSGENYRLIKL